MKKIFSFALALTMIISMFAVSANATTAAKFEISYTTADGDALDTTTLKAGDTFYINIDLKSVPTMFGADAILSWDSSVIQLVNKNGADIAESYYTKPAGFTVSRAAKTITDEFEETFLSESAQYYPASGTDTTARAEYTAFTTDATTLYQEDNSFLVYNFKVVTTGDAKIAFTGKVDEGQGAGSVNVTENSVVPALTVGSSAPVVNTKTVGIVGTLTYGGKAQNSEGVRFNLITDDEAKTTKTAVYEVPFSATFEADAIITAAFNITGVPKDVNITGSAELY